MIARIERKDFLEIYVKVDEHPEVCWQYTKDLTKARKLGTKEWHKVKRTHQKALRKQLSDFQKGK